MIKSRYQHKICLVMGGSRGIGLATAKLLYEEKGTIIICSSSQKSLESAKNSFPNPYDDRLSFIRCDIADKN